jgi:hypothetical protein
MTYTLDDFCRDAHAAMATDSGHAGRDAIRVHLEQLLTNTDFVAEHLAGQAKGKTELYHDDEFDFYVMAHGTDEGDRVGSPHDHGASWAVYGQAIGLTNMTVWDRTDDGSVDGHAELDANHIFPLEPGKAALFDSGVIHSTAHPRPARWVRVTGTNLDTIERYAYDPARKAMKRMNAA